MTTVVQFASPADAMLDLDERIGDLVEHIGDWNQRLLSLETALAEAAGENPLADLMTRIEQMETRLAKVENRSFRAPVSLIVNKASKAEFNQLAGQGDRYVRLNNEVDEHRQQIMALDNRSRSDAEAVRAECRRIDGRYDKAAKAFSELHATVCADLAAFRHALSKLVPNGGPNADP
jgi:predicted  nucleic acid-binding Zn-ribbon protein